MSDPVFVVTTDENCDSYERKILQQMYERQKNLRTGANWGGRSLMICVLSGH
jgi:hypothetical protein